ncbi:MAG: hypothetical protein K2G25_07325, partial [Oscillospiraceae bacterium]|nr:hypothetical protein [Oscillospiraceae bacterium]
MMNQQNYADYLALLSDWHKKMVEEHIADYGEILPHVLADCITVPLVNALRDDCTEWIVKYCAVLEVLWKEGSPEIQNVLEVTILERLTDDAILLKNSEDQFLRHSVTGLTRKLCRISGL